MLRTTYHKNPSGSATDGPETPPTHMANATQKVTGLVRQGGAVIGGQVAASVLTKMALDKFGGARTAPGTTARNAGNVGLPILLGMGILAFSKKNEDMQNAGLGAVVAGVGSAVKLALGENQNQFPFYPADGIEEAQVSGFYELPPASNSYALMEAQQAVHEVEVVSIDAL